MDTGAEQRSVVFLRDDDVDELTDPLVAMMSYLVDRAIPASYQVVPAKMSAETARHLRAQHRAHPDLIHIGQHGYRHQQTIDDELVWSEFAGSRPAHDQLEAIAHGRRTLSDRLGDSFDGTVFTPPCHKYDAHTVAALDSLGFAVLSASTYTTRSAQAYYRLGRLLRRVRLLGHNVSYHGSHYPSHALRELSVALDVDLDDSGERVVKPGAQLIDEFEAARERVDVIGLMLHHDCYRSDAKFEALGELLDHVRANAHRFESLAEL